MTTPIYDGMLYVAPTARDKRMWDMTVEEAFLLLCLFVGAWTIGTKIGQIIGEKINAAAGRNVPPG